MSDKSAASMDTSADEELVAAFRVAILRLSRRLQFERSGDDLSLNQLSVLGLLSRVGPQTIGDLATAERVKPPSMTRTVNALEEAGLVKRCAHESDGRQVVVKLTDEAEAVLAETRRRRDAWLADHLRSLDARERELLRKAIPLIDRLAGS